MDVSTRQERIAQVARSHPDEALTVLSRHLDLDWMLEAYRRTRKDGAVGVDRQTAQDYTRNLEGNLADLLERAKSGCYFAPPVRRAYVPKGDGKELRPIGIPTFEDKVLQRAIVMLLEPIYEQEFMEFSFGFRPNRSAHDALDHLWHQVMGKRIQWVLDVDLRKYFDSIDHSKLQAIVRRRVGDGVITRLIGKWLNAGVQESEAISYPEAGSPQGGVASPLLSNIFLHEVLDKWFVEIGPLLRGRSFMVRYADDFVMGFERIEDAERVMRALPKRLERFGLKIHPDKSRLVRLERGGPEGSKGQTFDFLGFTHYMGKGQKSGWVLRRKTSSARLSRGLKRIRQWCRQNLHRSLREQCQELNQKLRGHYGYYGITGNMRSLRQFLWEVKGIWKKWLNRRSRTQSMNWERFHNMLEQHYPLPPARIVHSVYAAKA